MKKELVTQILEAAEYSIICIGPCDSREQYSCFRFFYVLSPTIKFLRTNPERNNEKEKRFQYKITSKMSWQVFIRQDKSSVYSDFLIAGICEPAVHVLGSFLPIMYEITTRNDQNFLWWTLLTRTLTIHTIHSAFLQYGNNSTHNLIVCWMGRISL